MEVKLIDHNDKGGWVCATAARTCTSEEIPLEWRGWESFDEQPYCKALKSAIDSGHESVLEHATFTFAISGVSRALTHQLVRHRIASYSQQSQRYVKMDGFEYVTPESIKESKKIVNVRWEQDCFENIDMVDDTVLEAYEYLMEEIASIYHKLIKAGIPEEDARYILPNACCTNIIVTMNARELRHFFALRTCARAQWEIRELAEKMLEMCKRSAPIMFEDVGPQCVKLGYCPEARGCGRYPKKVKE